jgi:hypothetical protein
MILQVRRAAIGIRQPVPNAHGGSESWVVPEVGIVPDVFADADPDARAGDVARGDRGTLVRHGPSDRTTR